MNDPFFHTILFTSIPLDSALPCWLCTWLCVNAAIANVAQTEASNNAFALIPPLSEHCHCYKDMLACWKDVRGKWGRENHPPEAFGNPAPPANPSTEMCEQTQPRWLVLFIQHTPWWEIINGYCLNHYILQWFITINC